MTQRGLLTPTHEPEADEVSTFTRAGEIRLGDRIVTRSGIWSVCLPPYRPTRTVMIVTAVCDEDDRVSRFSLCVTELVRLFRKNGEHLYQFVSAI